MNYSDQQVRAKDTWPLIGYLPLRIIMPYHSHKGGSRSGNHVSLSLVSNRRVTVFHDHRPLFFPWTFVSFIAVICQVPSPLCIRPGPETAERTRHWFEVHCGALKTNGACVCRPSSPTRSQMCTQSRRPYGTSATRKSSVPGDALTI